MKEILIPSTGPRPICIVAWKPTINDRAEFDKQLKDVMTVFFGMKLVTKKTFEAHTYFTIGERLLYVPEMPQSRKFVKVQVEQKWLMERPEYKIDPTFGMYDVLIHEGIVYIRILLNRQISKMLLDIADGLANKLSQFGTTYFIYHQRMPGTSNANDVEYLRETRNMRVIEEQVKKPGQQKDVIKFIQDRYSIDLEKIIETFDTGIEIQCAPYDLKEYNDKLKFLIGTKESVVSKISFDEAGNDTVGKEVDDDIREIRALIHATETLVSKYGKIELDTVYFQLPPSSLNLT